MIQESLTVFLLAMAFDILLGEPPAGLHPVVWIGKLIAFLRARAGPSRLTSTRSPPFRRCSTAAAS